MNSICFTRPLLHTVFTVTPNKRVSLQDFAETFGRAEIEKISKLTGIESVSVAENGKTSADYCVEAAKILFEKIGITGADIDGLVYVTETPDHIIPATAPIIQGRLGIPTNTINFDLRCSCPGFIYGLFQASMLIELGCCSNILLLAGNTSSRLVNPQDRALLMVTGDAASAALITRSEDIKSTFSFFVDGSKYKSIYIPAGGSRMPIQKGVTDILEFDTDNNGHTKENLVMDGMEVMLFAIKEGRKLCADVMNRMNWSVDEVDLFLLHQANEMIVTRIAKGLKADMNKVPVSVKSTGNCGLASIPLTLCNKFEGIHSQLKRVVACGYGSGLIAAAGAIDLSKTNVLKNQSIKLD